MSACNRSAIDPLTARSACEDNKVVILSVDNRRKGLEKADEIVICKALGSDTLDAMKFTFRPSFIALVLALLFVRGGMAASIHIPIGTSLAANAAYVPMALSPKAFTHFQPGDVANPVAHIRATPHSDDAACAFVCSGNVALENALAPRPEKAAYALPATTKGRKGDFIADVVTRPPRHQVVPGLNLAST